MVNKFKDFLQKLANKFRKKSTRALPSDGAEIASSENEFQPPPLEAKKRFQAPQFSPLAHKAKAALLPLWMSAKSLVARGLSRSQMGQKLQKVDWGALADRLLARDSWTGHHRAFLATFLLVCTYSLGKITALVLRGRPELPTPIASVSSEEVEDFNVFDLNQVKASDPFRTKSGGGPKKIADTKCEESDSRTSLPLKLLNTVVLQDSVKSIAAVQVRSGRDLKQVREGDEIDGMARIARIARLEMIIKNLQTGACESVVNEKMKNERPGISIMSSSQANNFRQQQKIKGIDNQGNKYVIAKDLLDEKLKDISVVLTQARAIKIQNPDGTLAFKITEIEPGSIFSYLGIQNDDVITSIGGKPISDLNEVMSMFGRIKNLDNLQLGIRRDGEETNMDYQIKK
jgi:type II secretory pathway component PulC